MQNNDISFDDFHDVETENTKIFNIFFLKASTFLHSI